MKYMSEGLAKAAKAPTRPPMSHPSKKNSSCTSTTASLRCQVKWRHAKRCGTDVTWSRRSYHAGASSARRSEAESRQSIKRPSRRVPEKKQEPASSDATAPLAPLTPSLSLRKKNLKEAIVYSQKELLANEYRRPANKKRVTKKLGSQRQAERKIRLSPFNYKTKLCLEWLTPGLTCKHGDNCHWAHGEEELVITGQASTASVVKEILLPISKRRKAGALEDQAIDGSENLVDVCRNWLRYGSCSLGDKCEFAHGIESKVGSAVTAKPSAETNSASAGFWLNDGNNVAGNDHLMHGDLDEWLGSAAASRTRAQQSIEMEMEEVGVGLEEQEAITMDSPNRSRGGGSARREQQSGKIDASTSNEELVPSSGILKRGIQKKLIQETSADEISSARSHVNRHEDSPDLRRDASYESPTPSRRQRRAKGGHAMSKNTPSRLPSDPSRGKAKMPRQNESQKMRKGSTETARLQKHRLRFRKRRGGGVPFSSLKVSGLSSKSQLLRALEKCRREGGDWRTARLVVDHALTLHREGSVDRTAFFQGTEWVDLFERACMIFRQAGKWEECLRCIDEMEAVAVEEESFRLAAPKSEFPPNIFDEDTSHRGASSRGFSRSELLPTANLEWPKRFANYLLKARSRLGLTAETAASSKDKEAQRFSHALLKEHRRWVDPYSVTLEALADASEADAAIWLLRVRMIGRLGLEPNVNCWNACLRACVNKIRKGMDACGRYDATCGINVGSGHSPNVRLEQNRDWTSEVELLLKQFECVWHENGYTGPAPNSESYAHAIASCTWNDVVYAIGAGRIAGSISNFQSHFPGFHVDNTDTFFWKNQFSYDIGHIEGYGNNLDDAYAGNLANYGRALVWYRRQRDACRGRVSTSSRNDPTDVAQETRQTGVGGLIRMAEWDKALLNKHSDEYKKWKFRVNKPWTFDGDAEVKGHVFNENAGTMGEIEEGQNSGALAIFSKSRLKEEKEKGRAMRTKAESSEQRALDALNRDPFLCGSQENAVQFFREQRELGWEAPRMTEPGYRVCMAMLECLARSQSWRYGDDDFNATTFPRLADSRFQWNQKNMAGAHLVAAKSMLKEMLRQKDFKSLSSKTFSESHHRKRQAKQRSILAQAHKLLIRCCKNAVQAHEMERVGALWRLQTLRMDPSINGFVPEDDAAFLKEAERLDVFAAESAESRDEACKDGEAYFELLLHDVEEYMESESSDVHSNINSEDGPLKEAFETMLKMYAGVDLGDGGSRLQSWFEAMLSSGGDIDSSLRPSVETLTDIIRGFECKEHSNEAMDASRGARWPGHPPSVTCFRHGAPLLEPIANADSGENYAEIIEHHDGGKESPRPQLRDASCNTKSCIDTVESSGNAEEAERWYEEMLFLGIKPNNDTYRSLIRSCIDSGDVLRAEKYFRLMLDKMLSLKLSRPLSEREERYLSNACEDMMIVARRWGMSHARSTEGTGTTNTVTHLDVLQKMEDYLGMLRDAIGLHGFRSQIGLYNEMLEACTRAAKEEREKYGLKQAGGRAADDKGFQPYPGYHDWVDPINGSAARAEEIYDELRDIFKAKRQIWYETLYASLKEDSSGKRLSSHEFRREMEHRIGHRVTAVNRRTLSAIIECLDACGNDARTDQIWREARSMRNGWGLYKEATMWRKGRRKVHNQTEESVIELDFSSLSLAECKCAVRAFLYDLQTDHVGSFATQSTHGNEYKDVIVDVRINALPSKWKNEKLTLDEGEATTLLDNEDQRAWAAFRDHCGSRRASDFEREEFRSAVWKMHELQKWMRNEHVGDIHAAEGAPGMRSVTPIGFAFAKEDIRDWLERCATDESGDIRHPKGYVGPLQAGWLATGRMGGGGGPMKWSVGVAIHDLDGGSTYTDYIPMSSRQVQPLESSPNSRLTPGASVLERPENQEDSDGRSMLKSRWMRDVGGAWWERGDLVQETDDGEFYFADNSIDENVEEFRWQDVSEMREDTKGEVIVDYWEENDTVLTNISGGVLPPYRKEGFK